MSSWIDERMSGQKTNETITAGKEELFGSIVVIRCKKYISGHV
jgi:hypothetical protein